jgi:hypothetical protein
MTVFGKGASEPVRRAWEIVANGTPACYFHRMQSTSEISAFDRGVRPVMKIVLPEKAEEIVDFRADPDLQARIEELARKCTEGELSEAEQAEYAGYACANKFIGILQRQAREIIKARS